MNKNWGVIVTKGIVLSLLGTILVLLATAFARPALMSREIQTAEKLLARGQAGAALGHLDRCRRWSKAYPPLNKQRLYVSIRCHTHRSDLARAIQFSEELMDVDTYGFSPSTIPEKVEWLLVQAPLSTTLKSHNGHRIRSWEGYIATAADLRKMGKTDSLKAITKAILDRHQAHLVPEELKNILRPGRTTTQPSTISTVTTTPMTHSRPQSIHKPVHATKPVIELPQMQKSQPTTEPAAQPEQENAWGVVTSDSAPAYTQDGNHFMDLSAGTLLTIHDHNRTQSGESVSIGRILGGNGTIVMIRTSALDEQRGSLSTLSIDERKLRIRRAKLLAALHAQPEEQAAGNGSHGSNPHTATYRKARKEYLAFGERVKELTESMNAATGAKRMNFANELRNMKGEDIRLKAAYDAASEQYKAWRNAHPRTAQNGARTTSSRRRIEAEIADVERELRQL
ncbi:MAG: hypothetical protein ISS35_01875 [Kiritimatiellae bacterium]|nr:hypothetical protein [Kiritimatiellia bacterium]